MSRLQLENRNARSMHRYPIDLHGIYIAPAHRVFGKGKEDLNGEDLQCERTATLLKNSGIEGDRFCRLRPDYDGHVTFFSLEVWQEVAKALELPRTLGPEITRRNVIVSGIDLKALYGVAFEIQDIQFLGTVHCAPCLAMNRALGPGAREALRGRGGLRAQVKSNGLLQLGPCELFAEAPFDPANAASQPPLPDLP